MEREGGGEGLGWGGGGELSGRECRCRVEERTRLE